GGGRGRRGLPARQAPHRALLRRPHPRAVDGPVLGHDARRRQRPRGGGSAPLITLLLTALAVAMDAVAVSVSAGIARGSRATWGEALRMAGVFGLFQAVMPAIG